MSRSAQASLDQARFADAERLRKGGRFRDSLPIYRELLKTNRDSQALQSAYGAALVGARAFQDARPYLSRAVEKNPRDVEAWYELATSFRFDGRLERSVEVLERGLATNPTALHLISLRALFLHALGQTDEAVRVIAPLLDHDRPHAAVMLAAANMPGPLGRTDEIIDKLRETTADTGLPETVRIPLLFSLSQLLEKQGRYDDAWSSATLANGMVSTTFDPAVQVRAVESMIAHFTPERVAGAHRPRGDFSQPVFIVGMPRSGTSLVEQILSQHTAVYAGGELPVVDELIGEISVLGKRDLFAFEPRRLDRLSDKLRRRYRRLSPKAGVVTDKLPGNILQLGLISLLMPGARVIHCIRDARDTCVSCYMSYFFGTNNFIYDLTHLGVFSRATTRLAEHWKGVLDLKIHSLVYEDLIADIEPNVRSLLEFLELPFEEACLSPHKSERVVLTASMQQVRRPIYSSSIGRWKHYERYLGPLTRELEGARG